MDDGADLKVMKIKQWMEKTKDREQWRLVVEAKAHPGLNAERMDGWHDVQDALQLASPTPFTAAKITWSARIVTVTHITYTPGKLRL
jgi:hypothetical protein